MLFTTTAESSSSTSDLLQLPIDGNCSYLSEASSRRGFSYLLLFLFGVPASIIILVTVLGNFLVLMFKARVGKRQTTLLIWNLGLADFFVGLFVLPLGVSYVVSGRWYFGRWVCKIWASCDVVFCTASIVTLCIISVDRYIGVTRPLRYKLIVTKTKIKMANVAIWIFSIAILLATMKYEEETDCRDPDICTVASELAYVVYSVVFAFFLPAIITLLLYWKIYSVAKKRERGLMQGLMMAMGDNFLHECFAVPLRMHCGKNSSNSTVSQQNQIIQMHKKVAKTLGVVVSAFVMCWSPFFSLYLISYHCDRCIPHLVLDITTWLGYCNSCINPLIYAFTLSEFRKSCRQLYKRLTFCRLMRRKSLRNNKQSPLMPPSSNNSRPRYSMAPSLDSEKINMKTRLSAVADQDSVATNGVETSTSMVVGPSAPSKGNDTQVLNELVWSAKLYAMLISPQATKL